MNENAAPTLDASETPFRLLVESVADYAIFMLDPEGRIRSWNRGAERLEGYTRDEILGRHFSIFYTDEARDRGHPEEELRRALAEGHYEEDGPRVRKDGTLFWANVLITPVFDEAGRHLGFTKVTRDLTERRAAEETLRQSEESLRLIVGSVRDYAIFMLDPEGRIATWNTGAETIKGYRADEVIGKHFSLFYPAEDVASGRPQHALRTALAAGRYEAEGYRIKKSGERFWADVVITPIRDGRGELRGFVKVTRDLTDRRRMEQEAREAEARAARERERALEAQLAVKLRDDFISVASHELRTPLAALRLRLQGMERIVLRAMGEGGELATKLSERLRGANRQIDRLNDLVEQLLDATRVVGGKLEIRPEDTDLVEVVRSAVDDLADSAAQAGSEVSVRMPSSARGTWDAARIEQVVVNLLANAIKYGLGKPIAVAIDAFDDRARITVSDEGIGIAPESVERIFERFERAAPSYVGLGLGLYITRHIVDAHGGSIRVVSTPGQGSSFIVELPRAVASAPRAARHA
jgi:PAS domain S-box-containing protein